MARMRPSPGAGAEPSTPLADGFAADVYKLPAGSLPQHIWACDTQWKGNHYEARGWRSSKGYTYVFNVLDDKTKCIVASMDGRFDKPPKNCVDGEKVAEEALSAQQYADLVAQLLQVELELSRAERWGRVPSKTLRHMGKYEFKLQPKFQLRGLVAEPLAGGDPDREGEPHVAISVTHEAVPPANLNLGGLPATERVVERLRGMKVWPAPTEKGEPEYRYELCEPAQEPPLMGRIAVDGELRRHMLSLNLTGYSRERWQKIPDGSLVLSVRRTDVQDDGFRLAYLASDLRPTLSPKNQARLKKLPGFERWETFALNSPGVRDASVPEKRHGHIVQEIQRLRGKFDWLQPLAAVSQANLGHVSFRVFQKPTKVFGGNTPVQAERQEVIKLLERSGPFRLVASSPQAPKPRLRGILFGQATEQERDRASDILKQVRGSLSKMGVQWAPQGDGPEVVDWQNFKDLRALSGALDKAGLGPDDAVLLFATRQMKFDAEAVRERIKHACLLQGHSDRHLASQWIQLFEYVWTKPEKSTWSLMNVNFGMLAKLGHTPFGMDISSWFTKQSEQGRGVLIAGYDVCHLENKHVAVGVRVMTEAGHSRVLSRIESNVKRITGETVPAEMLRKIVPLEHARGKVIVIHRDGRLNNEEVASWRAYYEETLKETGASLLLVEVVKMVGWLPRMYEVSKGKLKNVKEGTYMQWSKRSLFLSSSKDTVGGTINPLHVHLNETMGEVSELAPLAWGQSVFDLSFMHHGSVFSAPKLPITTYFSDRLAYMVAKGGIDWDSKIEQATSGSQQPWL